MIGRRFKSASPALAAAFSAMVASTSIHAQQQNSLVWGEDMPASLDPHVVYDVPMQLYALNAYDSLYRYIGSELTPWLAVSHTVSEDGKTWIVKLRSDVKFADGTPMTAADVEYSFRRLLSLKQGPSGALIQVLKPEGVTATDDSTIQFLLEKPYAPFLATLPLVVIVNSKLVKEHEKNGDFGTAWLAMNSAGSGSYILDQATYKPLDTADFTRNAGHFYGWTDNPQPVDKIHVQTIKETSTRLMGLLRGDMDATDAYLPTDQLKRIEDSGVAHVQRDESMRVMVVRMNNKRAPFDNLNFRKCVSYSFNYQGFIEVVLGNQAIRNYGPLPRTLWGSPADGKGYDYDPDLAAKACEAAKAEGVDLSRPIEVRIQTGLDQTNQAAQLLQQGMADVGVNVQVVPDTWANLTTSTTKAETSPDMWIHWVSTYFIDPENWIGQMYDSQFHGTWKASSWYTNAELDSILAAARETTDQAERQKLYEIAWKTVVDDAVDLWIYNTVTLRGLSNRIEGFKFSPVGSGTDFRWLSIKQ